MKLRSSFIVVVAAVVVVVAFGEDFLRQDGCVSFSR